MVLAIFSFAYPLKYHVTFLLSHQSYSECKDESNRCEIVNKVCFCEIKLSPAIIVAMVVRRMN